MTKRNNRKMAPHMIKKLAIPAGCAFLVLVILIACSGGGDGDLVAGGGIGGTGISIGEISGFGSVIVNDVDFDTKKAQVIVSGKPIGNGDAIVQDVLSLRMIVKVEG